MSTTKLDSASNEIESVTTKSSTLYDRKPKHESVSFVQLIEVIHCHLNSSFSHFTLASLYDKVAIPKLSLSSKFKEWIEGSFGLGPSLVSYLVYEFD